MRDLLCYLSNSFKVCLFAFVILVSSRSVAQTSFNCPNANRCTSKDLSIVGAFLTGSSCSCSSDGTQTATLNMSINNTTGSLRTSFAFFGNLVKTDPDGTTHTSLLKGCGGPLPPNVTTTIQVGTTITYNCNQTLSLTNVYLAWTDAAGSTQPRCDEILADACVHIAPKCGTAPVIPINPLLSLQATPTDGCTGRSEGRIFIKPIGGKPNYTVSLKQGNTTVATQSNVTASGYTFTGLAEGDYTAVVTDAAPTPCTYSTPVTLGSHFCCTAPAIGTNPSNASACAGNSASFTASSTGGDPAPTVRWQEKVGNGSFADLSEGGVYSGTTTGTLNISDITGKNGNQYRAVFTSAGCAPATSAAATLTANSNPNLVITNPGAACSPNTVNLTAAAVTNGSTLPAGTTLSYWIDANATNALSNPGAVDASGTYYIKATTNTTPACTDIEAVTVTVNTSPSLPTFTITEPSLCGTGTGSINFCTTLNGYTYKVGDKSPINGTGSPQSVSGLAAGSNPAIEITNTNGGCKNTFTCSQASTCDENTSKASVPASESTTGSLTTVKAYPNPFSDKVKFVVTSPLAGKGNLDIYNMMGQRVKTVYQGFISAGTQTFELSLPTQQIANLVYVLRIGDKKISGKLLQINQ